MIKSCLRTIFRLFQPDKLSMSVGQIRQNLTCTAEMEASLLVCLMSTVLAKMGLEMTGYVVGESSFYNTKHLCRHLDDTFVYSRYRWTCAGDESIFRRASWHHSSLHPWHGVNGKSFLSMLIYSEFPTKKNHEYCRNSGWEWIRKSIILSWRWTTTFPSDINSLINEQPDCRTKVYETGH